MVGQIERPRGASDGRQKFQQLKTQLHRQMVDSIDISRAGQLAAAELRQHLRALASHLCSLEPVALPHNEREEMVQEILDEIFAFGPLQPLMNDPLVSDVLVNGCRNVSVERGGLLQPTDVEFADDDHLLRFIRRLVGRAGRRIDADSPMVDAKLPDGSHLNAVIPPLAVRGPTLSIRRFNTRVLLLDDMVRAGSLAPDMARFLTAAVRARLNIVLSGGAGTGKTTLLNVLSRFIPAGQRVVTIEETAELQLQQSDVVSLEMRHPNVEGRGEVSQRDLLRNSLRMRPDRIIVGEARGGEVLDMLQAMNTGHDGSMSTLHANDTRDALHRLEMMIALSGVDLPIALARQYIASAIQIIVHIVRLGTGERKVTRVSELAGFRDGSYLLHDIFTYRMLGIRDDNQAVGAFYATGYRPALLGRMAAAGHEFPDGMFEPRELTLGPESSPDHGATQELRHATRQ